MLFYRIMRRNALKLDGDRSSVLGFARGRIVLLSSFFALIYMMLAVRAFDVSIVQGYFWHSPSAAAIEGAVSSKKQSAHKSNHNRGTIVDRNGNALAMSLEMASLYADPKLIENPQTVSRGLVQVFPELSYKKTLARLQSKRRFVWVKRNITPKQQKAVMYLGDPGLGFRYEPRRVYPNKNMFSHIVGMTDIDNVGLSGIERSFDKKLLTGADVKLTLDVRFQHALRRELQASIDEFEAIGGAGVILDARSGAVLAGVSLPDFNPHEPGLAKSTQMFNRLTGGVYELGSVFKIFSTAAFLETHDVPMSTSFDATEPLKIGKYRISDYHAQKRNLTIPEVFIHSSNIGSALMAQEVGGERLRNFYRDAGLLDSLDIEVAEIAKPLVPDIWGEIATMTASYGHGIATTPLQVASAIASVVNGGLIVRPHLIQSAVDGDRIVRARIVSETTSYKMRELLRLNGMQGSGKKALVKGYKVGGKTGTAEKPGVGGYDRKRLISSFAGVFPSDDPQYVIYVALDEPKGNKKTYGYATAGWVAAPAVGRIVRAIGSFMDIEPSYDPEGYVSPLQQYVSEEG